MRRIKQFSVVCPAATEVLVSALQSTDSKKRSVVAVLWDQVATMDARAYIDQDLMIDFVSDLVPDNFQLIDFPVKLEVGQELKVGFNNRTAGALTKSVMVVYDEE